MDNISYVICEIIKFIYGKQEFINYKFFLFHLLSSDQLLVRPYQESHRQCDLVADLCDVGWHSITPGYTSYTGIRLTPFGSKNPTI